MLNPTEINREVQQVLRGFTQMAAGRVSSLPVVIQFYQRMEVAMAPYTGGLACNSGCSYCCHYHVYVTAPEAFALAEYTRTRMSELDRKAVVARMADNIEITKELTVAEHININVRCAFLSDSGTCLAYEVRPGACRRHHAVDVAPCQVTFHDPSSTMQISKRADLTSMAEAFMRAAYAAQHQLKVDDARYELTGAVYEAMTNKASLKRWRDGKNSFPSVKDRDLRRS